MRTAVLAAALLALGCGARAGQRERERERERDVGRAIFTGERPLAARLAGDDLALPPEASRCANCHLPAPAADAGAGALGPPLLGPALVREARRRGGPPSRYDADSLCRLLRTGIDPAQILVQRLMPRYEIDPAGCRALWAYLTEGT